MEISLPKGLVMIQQLIQIQTRHQLFTFQLCFKLFNYIDYFQ